MKKLLIYSDDGKTISGIGYYDPDDRNQVMLNDRLPVMELEATEENIQKYVPDRRLVDEVNKAEDDIANRG